MANTDWGHLRLTWEGWDGSLWEISDPQERFITDVLTTYQSSRNLLDNPGFESAIGPEYWTDDATLTRNTASARSGAYGGRLVMALTGSSGGAGPRIYGLTPARGYAISGYVRALTTTRPMYLQINWYDASDAYVSSTFSPTQTVPVGGGFTRLVWTGSAPAGCVRADICVVTDDANAVAGEQFDIDDFQLEEGPAATDWVSDAPIQINTPQAPRPVIESGVFIPREGVRGLSMPPIQRYTSESAMTAGSRYRGSRTQEREVFWPLLIASDESSEVFLARERAFFKTLRPTKMGTWRVYTPDGAHRSLRLRFSDDGDATHEHDPSFFGKAVYGIKLVAEQPFWEGQAVTRRWGIPGTSAGLFAGPGVINISAGQSLDSATISNPGDVDGWMIWTLAGAFASATVGVDGNLIQVPFALTADRKLVIDTRPDRLTAYEYAVTDTELTGAYIDRTDDLGDAIFGSVPEGEDVPLTLTLNSADTNAYAVGSLTPLYYRAW